MIAIAAVPAPITSSRRSLLIARRWSPLARAGPSRPQLHDSPQIELTSLTHSESHVVVQQYESCAQTLVTHESQPLVSLVPVEHSGCPQVPPPHDSWQTELTSPTQSESHAVVQQYESTAQICSAHALVQPWRPTPVEQIGCAQAPPPPVQVPDVVQVSPVAQLPQLPPQPSLPQVFPVQCGVQPPLSHTPPALQVSPVGQLPHVPPQPLLPQVLPAQFGVHVPPVIAVAFGDPMPVGPSQPAPALHSALVQVPLLPVVTSKNCDA
jgi:hypothetical protein